MAATVPPSPPPQVTTGMFADLAASSPAPIDENGNTMSTIAVAPRCAKFWIAALAWSALPAASMTETSQPSSLAAASAPLM